MLVGPSGTAGVGALAAVPRPADGGPLRATQRRHLHAGRRGGGVGWGAVGGGSGAVGGGSGAVGGGSGWGVGVAGFPA